MDYSQRINELINQAFGGNTYRASRTIGVPQPTLFRFVKHRTKRPGAKVLARIADYFGTSMEWLLTGVGTPPLQPGAPYVEWKRWSAIVQHLGLTPLTERAVLALPMQTHAAHFVLCDWGAFTTEGLPVTEKARSRSFRAQWRATAVELVMWAEFFEELVKAYGGKRLGAKLESEFDRLALGFQPFALHLLDDKLLPEDLSARFEEFSPSRIPPRHVAARDNPALPPLNFSETAPLEKVIDQASPMDPHQADS